ncbi:dihydrofolate reductase family protein [Kribbella qitaiheensis]|uniref:dihydrofolate reductase family protein n=1 Tax=Kribbella qitaiheensis TaxID=1544730 RepID=UPI00360B9BF4
MRKIIQFVHTSLDGYIEGPNGEFDWPQLGPELEEYGRELHGRADTFLYGRVTWEMMSGFWPQAESMSDDPHDLAFAPIWRKTPKVVVSTGLTHADWNTTVINRDVAARLTAMKEQPGGVIILTGGSTLAGNLTELGLLDEVQMVVHPVVLGGGKQLFKEGTPRHPVDLLESRTFDGRVVLHRHAPSVRG